MRIGPVEKFIEQKELGRLIYLQSREEPVKGFWWEKVKERERWNGKTKTCHSLVFGAIIRPEPAQ